MEHTILIITAIVLVYLTLKLGKSLKKNKNPFISFMETFNLTDMPIVTFLAGNVKLNFLLDTGATQSYVSGDSSKFLSGVEEMYNMDVTTGFGSKNIECKLISTTIEYNGHEYEVDLYVNKDLNESFKHLKKTQGITLHGILGTDFLNKYSYVLDFDKYLVYSKKK